MGILSSMWHSVATFWTVVGSLSYAFFQSFVQYWWGVWRVVWEDCMKRKKDMPEKMDLFALYGLLAIPC